MSLNNGKSIWADLPDAWQQDRAPEEKKPQATPLPEAERHPEPPAAAPEVPQPPKEERKEAPIPAKDPDKPEKISKEEYERYKKDIEEDRKNGSAHAQKAYLEEQKKNRRDFMILGIATAIVVVGIILFTVLFTETPTQRIYALVDQENYSTAYQEIQLLHQSGKNVDSLVFYFSENCAGNSEYKRAVAALSLLSPEAEQNGTFFENLVESLCSHNKISRARDVLDFMWSRGGALGALADELSSKYGI